MSHYCPSGLSHDSGTTYDASTDHGPLQPLLISKYELILKDFVNHLLKITNRVHEINSEIPLCY